MPVTRAQAEVILLSRTAYLMRSAHMDWETCDGTNPDLNDAIGFAARTCDLTVDNVIKVVDADLASLDAEDIDKFFDVAEFRVLQSILGNYDKFGLKVGPRSEYQSQIAERLEPRLKWMAAKMEQEYGVGASTVEAGYLSRNFAEHNEDLAEET